MGVSAFRNVRNLQHLIDSNKTGSARERKQAVLKPVDIYSPVFRKLESLSMFVRTPVEPELLKQVYDILAVRPDKMNELVRMMIMGDRETGMRVLDVVEFVQGKIDISAHLPAFVECTPFLSDEGVARVAGLAIARLQVRAGMTPALMVALEAAYIKVKEQGRQKAANALIGPMFIAQFEYDHDFKSEAVDREVLAAGAGC